MKVQKGDSTNINFTNFDKRNKSKLIVKLHSNVKLNVKVKRQLAIMGAKNDEIQTLFNLTLIRFADIVQKKVGGLVIQSSIEQYICKIAKYVYYEERKRSEFKTPQLIEAQHKISDLTPDIMLTVKEDRQMVAQLLQSLNEQSRKVIQFWAEGYSMAEIAHLTGYRSAGMVRKKKCEALKTLVGNVGKMA